MCSETKRATMSVGPPAAKGTIMVTGFEGQVCAMAGAARRAARAKAAENSFFKGRLLIFLFIPGAMRGRADHRGRQGFASE
jgi:hypothetical protein